MSNVRLSTGSPTLERVDSGQVDHAKPPVRRNLFGSMDSEEFKKECNFRNQEAKNAFAEKWNFDCSKNEPLANGKYVWEAVSSTDLPEYYTRMPHKRADHNGNHDYLLQNRCPADEDEHEHSKEGMEKGDRQTDCRESRTVQRKRTAASQESANQNKRPHNSSEEALSAVVTSSAEHTPGRSEPRTQT